MAASDYLTLGRGELYFAPFLTGTYTPGGFISFGNCPDFNLNVSYEELNHMDSRDGFKEEDENVMIAREVMATFNCDNISPANAGKFFLGSNATVTQTSASSESESIASAVLGATYQLGVTTGNPTGVRNISNVSVEVDSTGMTLDTDYTLDTDRGLITIIDGGGISADDQVDIGYDRAAATRSQVQSGNQQVEGALLFLARNARGVNQDVRIPRVKVRPQGDLTLIGDDWSQMNFDLRGLKLANQELLYMDGPSTASS